MFLAPAGYHTVFGQDSIVRFQDVKDGSSVTLSVVEVDAKFAVPWTAPDDYQFDKAQPAAKLAFAEDGISYGAVSYTHLTLPTKA